MSMQEPKQTSRKSPASCGGREDRWRTAAAVSVGSSGEQKHRGKQARRPSLHLLTLPTCASAACRCRFDRGQSNMRHRCSGLPVLACTPGQRRRVGSGSLCKAGRHGSCPAGLINHLPTKPAHRGLEHPARILRLLQRHAQAPEGGVKREHDGGQHGGQRQRVLAARHREHHQRCAAQRGQHAQQRLRTVGWWVGDAGRSSGTGGMTSSRRASSQLACSLPSPAPLCPPTCASASCAQEARDPSSTPQPRPRPEAMQK